MSRKNSTKIISTIGPASNHKKILFSMVQNGVNAFRLNFSHGTHNEQRKKVYHIRQYEKSVGRPIAILGD